MKNEKEREIKLEKKCENDNFYVTPNLTSGDLWHKVYSAIFISGSQQFRLKTPFELPCIHTLHT